MTGLGTDIIEINRIERALCRPSFMQRIFTKAECDWLNGQGNNLPQSAAGLFCAKEAVAKALGTGFQNGLNLKDIEISHTELGAPFVLRPHRNFLLSIAHCQSYATATAILLDRGNME